MLKLIRNTNGVSIVEVLVAAGLTSIVSLGVATMIQNTMVEQKKAILFSTLKELKTRIEFLARDQNAWNQTVNCTPTTTPACATYNSSATFTAMRAGTAVTEVSYATPEKVMLMDASGQLALNLLGPADTAGNGFTESGAACSTFSTTTGVDECPISYRLLMGTDCPTGASCTNPQLKIVARLVYNPSTSGVLNRYRALIAQIAGSSILDSVADGKYDASVKRTGSQINRSFRIISSFTPAGAGCTAAGQGGAGRCTTSLAVHGATSSNGWSEDNDAADLVGVAGGNPLIQFKEAGYYSCAIAVPAWATLGFTAELYNEGTDGVGGSGASVASANTNAGYWSQSTAVIDTKFNVGNVSDRYAIRQRCDVEPPGANFCALGMATSASYGTSTAVISMSCYKVDRSL